MRNLRYQREKNHVICSLKKVCGSQRNQREKNP